MKVSKSTYLTGVRPLLQQLITALQSQFRYVSVLGADCRSRSYSVSGSGIRAQAGELHTQRGFVLRVMDDTGFAEYSFQSISQETLPQICRQVHDSLLPLKDCPPAVITAMERGLPEDAPLTFADATEYELHPLTLGDEAILSRLSAIRQVGLSADERIVDCIARLGWQEIHKVFLSPNRDLEQDLLWTDGAVMAMARRGEELKDSYHSASLLGGAELLDTMEALAPKAAATALELLHSEPLPPGTYDCICTPEVTGMIVHEAFGHGVEMDMFVKDRALAKQYVGRYVASPLVTMHDGAAAAKQTGSYFFDDEGTMACDTVVIDHGVLVTGISDSLSAGFLGTRPTGNGRRESFSRKAYTRMTNTWFEGGTDSPEDMIAAVSDGLLLEEPTSGMEDPKNWGIQCMVSYAREIKNGRLTGRIFSPIVLTGYVPDLLKSISMMSPTVELAGGGMCGKGYKEWVKVSDGGPYIRANIRLG